MRMPTELSCAFPSADIRMIGTYYEIKQYPNVFPQGATAEMPALGHQSPKMRSGESPATTRRHLQSVAVEKATAPEAQS